MGAGKRRQIRKQIVELIIDCYRYDIPHDMSTLNALAGDIMRLFPKPEVTVIHRKKTEIFKIPYYKCGKCGYIIEREECSNINYYKFCPICGRRILAVEDDTICQ